MKKNSYCLLFIVYCLLFSSAATAGELDELSDSSRVVDLDEVIVVSQPKEQVRLRLQPLSSTVVSSEDISRLGVRDVRELSLYVPSFAMPNYGSRYTSSMYIRGIGSRVNSPSVSMYVDGLPLMNKSQMNAHMYEVSRVDVLRGPQSTLYGQNSEGGLIRLYSKNPMDYQGTDVNLGIGSRFYRKAEVVTYQRPSEKFAFSLAAFYDGQNGFFRNMTTGDRADNYNEAGGKLRLLYQPSERLTFDFISDYQWVRQNAFPYGVFDPATDVVQSPSTNHNGRYHRSMVNSGLNIHYAAPSFDLFSTTSYQFFKDHMLMDIDYLPADNLRMEQNQLGNALTQEIVAKSRTTGRWHRTTGLFGSYQWLHTNAPVYFDQGFNDMLSKTIHDAAYYPMLKSMAARMGEEAAAAMIESRGGVHIDMQMSDVPGHFDTPQANLGIFHESAIDLTDRLTATLGLRYDLSHVKIQYETSASASIDMSVMGVNVKADALSELIHNEKDTYHQLLPKFGLSYRLDDESSNIYVTVAKGYRAGGFNMQMFSDILQAEVNDPRLRSTRQDLHLAIDHDDQAYDNIRNTIRFKPEESWNYEFGTHLNLFNRQLQFDLSAFYMQIRNQQLSVMAGQYGFGRMMVNAGRSASCGIEAMLRGSAFDDHFTWSLSYGYTRAVFKEYQDSVMVDGANVLVDYKDKRVPFVPEHTIGASADYRFTMNGAMKSLTLGLNFSGQGKTWWDEANTYSQKLYALLGAHVAADFGSFSVNLWARNLTNTTYNTFALYNTSSNSYFAQRGNPFQMGVDVKIHF